MIKLIQYFKTAKGRTNLKWGLVVLVLVVVVIYLFRRVNDSGSNDPLAKRLQEQLDSVVVVNKALAEGRVSDQHIIDSVTIRSQQIQTKIIEIPKYVEIQVRSVDTFGVLQLESFFAERYRPHP